MVPHVRGDPFITFAPRGGGGREVANYANDSTDRLRDIANKASIQNPENFANVINGCPLSMINPVDSWNS